MIDLESLQQLNSTLEEKLTGKPAEKLRSLLGLSTSALVHTRAPSAELALPVLEDDYGDDAEAIPDGAERELTPEQVERLMATVNALNTLQCHFIKVAHSAYSEFANQLRGPTLDSSPLELHFTPHYTLTSRIQLQIMAIKRVLPKNEKDELPHKLTAPFKINEKLHVLCRLTTHLLKMNPARRHEDSPHDWQDFSRLLHQAYDKRNKKELGEKLTQRFKSMAEDIVETATALLCERFSNISLTENFLDDLKKSDVPLHLIFISGIVQLPAKLIPLALRFFIALTHSTHKNGNTGLYFCLLLVVHSFKYLGGKLSEFEKIPGASSLLDTPHPRELLSDADLRVRRATVLSLSRESLSSLSAPAEASRNQEEAKPDPAGEETEAQLLQSQQGVQALLDRAVQQHAEGEPVMPEGIVPPVPPLQLVNMIVGPGVAAVETALDTIREILRESLTPVERQDNPPVVKAALHIIPLILEQCKDLNRTLSGNEDRKTALLAALRGELDEARFSAFESLEESDRYRALIYHGVRRDGLSDAGRATIPANVIPPAQAPGLFDLIVTTLCNKPSLSLTLPRISETCTGWLQYATTLDNEDLALRSSLPRVSRQHLCNIVGLSQYPKFDMNAFIRESVLLIKLFGLAVLEDPDRHVTLRELYTEGWQLDNSILIRTRDDMTQAARDPSASKTDASLACRLGLTQKKVREQYRESEGGKAGLFDRVADYAPVRMFANPVANPLLVGDQQAARRKHFPNTSLNNT